MNFYACYPSPPSIPLTALYPNLRSSTKDQFTNADETLLADEFNEVILPTLNNLRISRKML
jgi:hypothetical protein